MVQKTARTTIGGVDRTEEAPTLGQERSYSGGFEFGEECTTVNASKVTDVSLPIEFFGDDGETGGLLKVEPSG